MLSNFCRCLCACLGGRHRFSWKRRSRLQPRHNIAVPPPAKPPPVSPASPQSSEPSGTAQRFIEVSLLSRQSCPILFWRLPLDSVSSNCPCSQGTLRTVEAQLARARSAQQEELLTQVSLVEIRPPLSSSSEARGPPWGTHSLPASSPPGSAAGPLSSRLGHDHLLVCIVGCFGHSPGLQPHLGGRLKYEKISCSGPSPSTLSLSPPRPPRLFDCPIISRETTVVFCTPRKRCFRYIAVCFRYALDTFCPPCRYILPICQYRPH